MKGGQRDANGVPVIVVPRQCSNQKVAEVLAVVQHRIAAELCVLAVDVEDLAERCGEKLFAEGLQSLGSERDAFFVQDFEPAQELADGEPRGEAGRRVFP